MKPGWRQGYSYSYKGAASIHAEARKYLKYSYERIFASPGSSSFAADCKSAANGPPLDFPPFVSVDLQSTAFSQTCY